MSAARVLHVINTSEEGGGARHLHALVTRLDRKRFEPMVATGDRGPLVERLARQGIPVERIEMMRGRLDPRPVWRLYRLLSRQVFDLVHLHGTRAGFFGTLAVGLLARRPRVVYTVHGLSCSRQASGAVRGLFARVERFIAQRADRVISVSEHDRATGVEAGLLPVERSCSIPNGIEIPPQAGRRGGAAEPEVLVVGRLVPQKGIAVLLRAASRVLAQQPRVRFVLAGDGPLRRQLESLARRLGITDRVRFLGTVQDTPALLRRCDLFVLPSLWEGMSLSLLEAMAAGAPAVATSVSGSTELIVHGNHGLLVPPDDSDALADAILRMLDDAAAAGSMGSRARRRVQSEFSLERMAESTHALYCNLLAEPEPGRVGAREVRLT